MESLTGKNKRVNKRNLSLLICPMLLTILLATPALAATGQYTGCIAVTKGTLYNIQAGSSPKSTCLAGDIVISFYDNATVNALKTQVNTLQGQVTTLRSTLQGVTRSGNDIHIKGANLHIESGSGKTNGTVNGLGNLIIGYNELRGSGDNRTGSHNLIIGVRNNYRSYGGLVAGYGNEISAPYASVSGGGGNIASEWSSSVSGGHWNNASGLVSSVSGGDNNTASNFASSVSGGNNRKANGEYDWVAGSLWQNS